MAWALVAQGVLDSIVLLLANRAWLLYRIPRWLPLVQTARVLARDRTGRPSALPRSPGPAPPPGRPISSSSFRAKPRSATPTALRACRPHFVAAAVFSALINLLFLAPALYMLQVYDRVVATGGKTTLFFITLALVVALLTLAALPLGAAIGFAVCALLAFRFESDLFRLPLVVSARTYLYAFLTVAASALASGLAVRRRLNRLDLVEVLKTRE